MTPNPSELDVFLEYRLTSALLSLVTTLAGQACQDQQGLRLFGYDPPLDYSVPSRRRLLNAFANVLVRNVEVVAVTTSGFAPPLGGCTSVDTPNTMNVLVVHEENSASSTVVTNSQPPGLLAPGQSKWAEIMASPWSCLAKPNEILSLSDHLATIQEYLNDYQLTSTQPTVPKPNDDDDRPAEPNPDEEESKTELGQLSIRGEKFHSFLTYLISTCYPRVRRQLSNRLSKKLSSLLSSITGPQLEQHLDVECLKDPQPRKWNNLLLCKVVHLAQTCEDPYDIRAMVQELKAKHYPSQSPSPAEEELADKRKASSPLFDALSQTIELIQSGTKDLALLPILYTKETYVDFHYLLLLALNKHSDAVFQFYDHVVDGSVTDKDRRDLRMYSSLLWRLAHSSILSDHLEFICKLLPYNFMCSDLITENGGQHGHESQTKDGLGGGEVLEDEDASSDDDDGGVREEMAALEGDLRHRRDPVLMIQRWLWLLVSHLQALHLLSSCAFAAPRTVVRIQHLAVQTTPFEAPQDWTAVLRRSLTASEFGSLRLSSRRLEELILGKINAAHEAGSGQKGIFRYFRGKDILSGCGHVHCEAGLAAALHSPPPSGSMMQEHGFEETNILAVSRRSCVLCWELLSSLRWDRFGVRSPTHPPPTPTELPGWIRRETAEKLLQSLRDRLNKELRLLLQKSRRDNRRDGSVACDDIILDLAALFNLEASCRIPRPTLV